MSSRCGAVKSVLCPKRLVTVERPPAIRGFFVSQPRGSQQRSHPALLRHQSPPSAAPPRASAAGWTPAGRARRLLVRSPPGPEDPGAPGGRPPPAVAVSAATWKKRVSGPVSSRPLGRCRFFSDFCVPAHRPLNRTNTRLHRNPRVRSRAAELAKPRGPRRRARPFAQPHRRGSSQRAGAGRGDGVLTPSPSPFSARH